MGHGSCQSAMPTHLLCSTLTVYQVGGIPAHCRASSLQLLVNALHGRMRAVEAAALGSRAQQLC